MDSSIAHLLLLEGVPTLAESAFWLMLCDVWFIQKRSPIEKRKLMNIKMEWLMVGQIGIGYNAVGPGGDADAMNCSSRPHGDDQAEDHFYPTGLALEIADSLVRPNQLRCYHQKVTEKCRVA